ncbi:MULTISPECIES: PAAR domain-containing protein [unclassified Cupriavidus]|uniref:PAAR domain-containing protein n=1 Tax=unclassified Cupriavidus TaxID=2640874 RepID=UPI001C00861B|nr:MULTISPECIES: PAAR domain-containing protein [unclassified Cupriavidus]MCA3774590.1 PAAR domain-containing protein [Cutibacterium sp.]MCA3183608.1 PAAR domain-containing protein [Cupriavidus sp.]MCA3193347.1 PAAR domain-containing protein [Cupriavidus sp.]MCA3198149.1 PAAR domain-containing protein [Cupriavidus sp.]MCA3204916.1 PAAR domain-containing protein [Cupriavidus sp.]
MRKAAVRHGDPTTTGGIVLALSSTIFDDGKRVALSGDGATCGQCDGTYRIFGTGKGMSEQGRDVAIDGDFVLCPCGKNRVMVGAAPGIFLQVGDPPDSPAAMAEPSKTVAHPPAPFDQRVQIFDELSGQPLAGVRYRLSGDVPTLEGITDESGMTERVAADHAATITVEIFGEGR